MSMAPEGRERMIARRLARLESMEQPPDPPEIGSEAPDFDLAVLNGDGARVRLRGLRGRPVGLIFGSYT